MPRSSLTKKPTTNTSEQTRRNGHHETRNRYLEELAVVADGSDEENEEEDEIGDQAMENVDGEEEEERDGDWDDAVTEAMSVVGESQESGAGRSEFLEELMQKIVLDQRKRVHFKKDKIHKKYKENVEETKQAVNTLFENHETESARIHNTQINRLQELLENKAKLEAEMESLVANMQYSYATHCRDLRIVAKHHITLLLRTVSE
ncbi:hypothetical protein P154DRAFT_568245 [Amniculicola lignicola CBS 123094]|uniref:Uncharacterized protein n=1 Tax=Amniculicola lignicola CBS 123094 TaxID=1392246 RepID=A0A6A5VVR6_9PLEO|nr:hypothetical protein P154DRAFT_568245 [Amniculicola lignicola CBS 123094]